MKAKLLYTPFVMLRFVEKSFGIPYWIKHHFRILNLVKPFMLIAQVSTLVIKISIHVQ